MLNESLEVTLSNVEEEVYFHKMINNILNRFLCKAPDTHITLFMPVYYISEVIVILLNNSVCFPFSLNFCDTIKNKLIFSSSQCRVNKFEKHVNCFPAQKD
jgi:hypothetical protein